MEEDCPICLQKLQYPVTLPCKHKFCFLCVKGTRSPSTSKTCALCRLPFSLEEVEQDLSFVPDESSEVKWFYSGKENGWWQYDERASADIEAAYQDKEQKQVHIYIVGFMYTVDFEKMIQFRNSEPTRHRKIKRESTSTGKDFNVKGIAGIAARPPVLSTAAKSVNDKQSTDKLDSANTNTAGSNRGETNANQDAPDLST